MGGAAFILLKAGQARPESAKQAEIRLAILLKILRIARFVGKNLRQAENHMLWLHSRRFPPDMANLPGIAGIVIQITFVAQKPAQYSARKCRKKITQVLVYDSIR